MTCRKCGFCVCDCDGTLMCAIRGEPVGEYDRCDMGRGEHDEVGGDGFYEERAWPSGRKRRKSPSS